ncbi:MAG: cation:proton antiporter [Candidatus Omnitrophica bacterium]|nr:cation:proton antiporter [Candidatus Omnitrophota bacterium]
MGILLGAARGLGELARRLHQPSVLGEILAGVLLGPTVVGHFFPEWYAEVFPAAGPTRVALEGMTSTAIAFFLLVAGMEVDLSLAFRQGKAAIVVGLVGFLFPFACAFLLGWSFLDKIVGNPSADPMVLALFFATALSITALPVIAKILMDLNLFRTDVGTIIIAGAILNDLIGWNIFAVLIGMVESGGSTLLNPLPTLGLTLAYALALLTLGRWTLNQVLPWLQAHTSWPGGVLGFIFTLALLSAALTEWIGVHALFGAFLFGIAVGDSRHLRQRTRTTIDQFVSFIFAPLFFASIGLRVDFVSNFSPSLVVFTLVIAVFGKVVGCGLAASWCGLSRRESIAVGFGMSALGAMAIIVGLYALQLGAIDESMFVALVVMAVTTSLGSGAMIQRVLKRRKALRFTDFLSSSHFVASLEKVDRLEVIRELVERAVKGTSLDHEKVIETVWRREQLMSTGLENGLALPHARLADLERPILAVGISRSGVDFDSFDGQPARLIFLLLTPREDNGAQVEILADIGRRFQDARLAQQAAESTNYTEFLALMRSHEPAEVNPTPAVAL